MTMIAPRRWSRGESGQAQFLFNAPLSLRRTTARLSTSDDGREHAVVHEVHAVHAWICEWKHDVQMHVVVESAGESVEAWTDLDFS